jgi:hypothetical protein
MTMMQYQTSATEAAKIYPGGEARGSGTNDDGIEELSLVRGA